MWKTLAYMQLGRRCLSICMSTLRLQMSCLVIPLPFTPGLMSRRGTAAVVPVTFVCAGVYGAYVSLQSVLQGRAYGGGVR